MTPRPRASLETICNLPTAGTAEGKTSLRFRDHGHEENIKKSYEMPYGGAGCAVYYVWETGALFLATKKALETKTRITINGSFSV